MGLHRVKKYLLILSIILLTCVSAFSQESATLNVKIKLKNNEPASYANLVLLNLKDSTSLSVTSDLEGLSNISGLLKQGQYQLSIYYLGYKKKSLPIIFSLSDTTTLNIELEATSISLQEVIVKSKRPMIERIGEKLILNIESLSNYANEIPLIELLNYAPGIIVDNGNIILNGKPGVKITIDGRDQPNSAKQVIEGLLSSNIGSIEIIQNPSSIYDAAGAAGIINIVTKRNFGKLFNNTTTTSISQAKRTSYSLSNSMTIATDKILMTNSLSFLNNHSRNDKSYIQLNPLENGLIKLTEDSKELIDVNYPTANIDLDYKLKPGQTVNGGFNAFGSKRTNYQNSLQSFYFNNAADEHIDFSGNTSAKILNTSAYIGLTSELDTLGSNRKVFFNYTTFSNSSEINNLSKDPNSLGLTNGNTDNKILLFTGNLDYSKILNNQSSLKYGLKFANSKIDNFSDYNFSSNNQSQNDKQIFKFNEQIGAGYLDYSHAIKQFSYNIGLRTELTNFENAYNQNNLGVRNIEKTYISVFPSFNLNYSKDQNNIISFFGGRRINRPLYDFLSPFIQIRNNYSYTQGNPYLKPMFAYNLGISYLLKGQYSFSLSYSFIDQVFASTQRFDNNTNDVIYSIGNLRNQKDVSFSVSSPFNLGEKLSFNTSVNILYNKFISPDYLTQFQKKGSMAFNCFLSSRYQLTKKFSLSSAYYYFTGSLQSQLKSFPRSYLNFNARYTLVPNKSSISLRFSDIFFKNNYKEEFKFDNSFIESYSRSDTRSVQLSFTYRFGKLKSERSASQRPQNEEKNRIKTQ